MVLVAFLVGLAAALIGIVFVAVRGLELWRHGKRSGGAITSELARFEERSARTEQLLAEAEQSNQRAAGCDSNDSASRARSSRCCSRRSSGAQRRTRWLRAFLPTR